MHCDSGMEGAESSTSNDFPNHVQYTVVEVDAYSLCRVVKFLVMSSHVDWNNYKDVCLLSAAAKIFVKIIIEHIKQQIEITGSKLTPALSPPGSTTLTPFGPL